MHRESQSTYPAYATIRHEDGVWRLKLADGALRGIFARAFKSDISFDGKTLQMRGLDGNFDIPADHIRAIRQVRYDKPTEKTAVEIQTVHGPIVFFRRWDEMKVAWTAENLRRLVPRERHPTADAEIAKPSPDAAISTRLYGKSLRQLAVGLGIAGALLTLFAGWFTLLGIRSAYWPHVEGHVLSSEYRVELQHETHYEAKISYAYNIDGRDFTNDDIGISRAPSDSDVISLVNSHPKGSTVTVYYDPAKPSRSLVIPGLSIFQGFWSFLAALPLLAAIPLAMQRSTPAQAAVVERYRVPIQQLRRDKLPPAKIKWRVPDQVWQLEVRQAKRAVLWMGIRINLATLAAVGIAFVLMGHLKVDLPWQKIVLAIPGMTLGLLALMCLEVTLRRKRQPPEYALTDAGILLPFGERPLIPWSRLLSFTVNPAPGLPAFNTLVLHTKKAHTCRISLPAGDAQSAVLSQLASHLPQSFPPPSASPLKTTDWILGLILMTATLLVEHAWASRHLPLHSHSELGPLMFLITALAGPGTWLALALQGRRAPEPRFALAYTINMLTLFGSIFILISLIAKTL